ncbi:MAG: hypothetical protein ABI725_10400 [Chloroflexota bacterium]
MIDIRHYKVVGTLVFAVVVLGALAIATGAAPHVAAQDPNMLACGVTSPSDVAAAFPLQRASDFRSHLPHALGVPELDRSDPAYVVVFAGPRAIGVVGAPALDGRTVAPRVYDHVVCVIIDGDPTFYANVNTADMTP